MTSIPIPTTTYLIPVGAADVPRMSAMNAIFDDDSIRWTIDKTSQTTRSLLDVGCGNGELTIKLAQKLGEKVKIVAIDRSEEQIRIARENSKKIGVNITWIVKDAYQIEELKKEYKEGFDIVHCRFILSHLRQPKEAIRKMAYLVAEKGSLVMEELAGHHYKCLPSEPFCMKVWRWAVSVEHMIQGSDLSAGGRLANIVKDIGLKNIEVSKPHPIAASEEQKIMFPLSLDGLKTNIPSVFHFLINPWVEALRKMQKDPNYSVGFIDFIQVKAIKK